jgi:hypothetical protein
MGHSLPTLDFLTAGFLRGGAVKHTTSHQPGEPGLRICNPGRQGGSVIPQALGTHFNHLLRHARVTVGLF